jgi:hypothetical protein
MAKRWRVFAGSNIGIATALQISASATPQAWCKLVRAVRRLQTRRNSHEQGIVQHIP